MTMKCKLFNTLLQNHLIFIYLLCIIVKISSAKVEVFYSNNEEQNQQPQGEEYEPELEQIEQYRGEEGEIEWEEDNGEEQFQNEIIEEVEGNGREMNKFQSEDQQEELLLDHDDREVEEYTENSRPPVYRPEPKMFSTDEMIDGLVLVPQLGLVQGLPAFKIINDRPINAYFGLKYGTVQPGLGRFQKAAPYENYDNLINATHKPENCPQFLELKQVSIIENSSYDVDDCLTLTIYTPARKNSYPVLVFVHGEMLYDGGSEEAQPDYLLAYDLVLVTINYRLAPFGYLSSLTSSLPGNVALADLQMALEWIQQHIRYFNGDPQRVTVMGQAAGATLVHALSLSEEVSEAGLFQQLILQSGTAINPYFLDEHPLNTLRNFIQHTHCPPLADPSALDKVLVCLDRMTTTNLLRSFQSFYEHNKHKSLLHNSGFKLIIGDQLNYLPRHPAALMANTKTMYPTLIGVTKDAGAFLMSNFYEEIKREQPKNIGNVVNILLKHVTPLRHYKLWKQVAMEQIFVENDPRKLPNLPNVAQKLLELVNLIVYRAPIIETIQQHLSQLVARNATNSKLFLYSFDYRGQYHRYDHRLPFEVDATLTDDSLYLFPYPYSMKSLNENDRLISNEVIRLWYNFIAHGIPEINDEAKWPNVSNEYGPVLHLNDSIYTNNEINSYFTDGIIIPHLYPEYINRNASIKMTTTTTTTTTTTAKSLTNTIIDESREHYPQYPYVYPYRYRQKNL